MERDLGPKKGFTLVELLVVIAIIGILVALLLPAIQAAREAARRTQCENHLKQISLAIHNYENIHKGIPRAAVGPTLTKDRTYGWSGVDQAFFGRQGHSWIVLILPQLELQNIYDAWDFSETSNVSKNSDLATQDIPDFYCPTRRSGVRDEDIEFMPLGGVWTSGGNDYGANVGFGNCFQDLGAGSSGKICKHPFGRADDFLHALYDPEKRCGGPMVPWGLTRVAQITDGTSHTILVGELQRTIHTKEDNCSFRFNDGWAIGGVSNLFDVQMGTINDTFFESPGSDHPGGAQFAMADGSVHFLSNNIDSDTLRAYASMDAEDVQRE